MDRLLSLVRREPEDREGIKAVLEAAHERALLDAESYQMIRGALAVSEGIVADIMVPRSRMDLLDVTQPIPYLVASVIETAHSRFPSTKATATTSSASCWPRTRCAACWNPASRCARWSARRSSFPNPSA